MVRPRRRDYRRLRPIITSRIPIQWQNIDEEKQPGIPLYVRGHESPPKQFVFAPAVVDCFQMTDIFFEVNLRERYNNGDEARTQQRFVVPI